MTTLDTVFIIITASAISLFFIVCIGLSIYAWVVFNRLAKKAEMALEGVEAVSDMLKDVGKAGAGKTVFKLIKFLAKLSRKD